VADEDETDSEGHSESSRDSGDEFESLQAGSMVVTADEYEPKSGTLTPFITVSEVTGDAGKEGDYRYWPCLYYECSQEETSQAAVEGKWTRARGPKAKGTAYEYQLITTFDGLLQNGKLPAAARAAVAADPFFDKLTKQ
jgi:hypothetical protein